MKTAERKNTSPFSVSFVKSSTAESTETVANVKNQIFKNN